MNNKWIKTLPFLILLLSLTACSNFNKFNTKGNPQRVGGTFEPQLEEAMLAYQQGRLSSAETLYIQYVNRHPKYTEAWFKLGNIYYRTGQYPAAITAYENVIRQTPRNGKAWHNLALTRVKQAEVTLMKAETVLGNGDPQKRKITALKNKIRGGGVRQVTPAPIFKPNYKVIPRQVTTKARVAHKKRVNTKVRKKVIKRKSVVKGKRKVYRKPYQKVKKHPKRRIFKKPFKRAKKR